MLSVCILNYNGKGMIERCVNSVLGQSKTPDEIIIIDNGSTDDSWKTVEKDVTRVVHGDNTYKFIGGLNTAFKVATHRYVCFMENDVVLHERCLGHMFDSPANIVSPQFFDKDGFRYKEEWFSGFLTACFMMSVPTFRFIGEFDKNLAPAYWEDVDYTLRARRMGFTTKKGVGKAIHYANWSFSKVFTKKQMGGWCRRNAMYLIRKHFIRDVQSGCNE